MERKEKPRICQLTDVEFSAVVPPDQMSNLIDENFEQIYEELKQFYTLKEFIEPVLNEIQNRKDSPTNQEEGL